MKPPKQQVIPFTGQEKFVIFLLAITQFSVILDFMVMSPLGDMLSKSLSLKPHEFAMCVSAYGLCAGASGLLTAGFADRFDRKKLLLFFFCGFTGATIFCGLATTFPMLLAARIVTGLFGGVIGSISMAIITDLFSLHQRGRVMGFVQMGFGASQALGIPISLFIANHLGWQSPFLAIGGLAAIIILLIVLRLQPVTAHLAMQEKRNIFLHLWNTVKKRDYRTAFAATALLSVGGFMMMPFGSAFAINNLQIAQDDLPYLFTVSGISALIIMPLVGRLADKVDKFKLFVAASVWMTGVVVVYTNLGVTPLWLVMILNVMMMMGIMSRMVPSMALATSIPDAQDRGAFMSVNSSLQQIAGGIAAIFAGTIVQQQTPHSPLEHYNTLGYIIVGLTVITIYMLYRVNAIVKRKAATQPPMKTPKGEDLMEAILEA